jgi:hypothetical protein
VFRGPADRKIVSLLQTSHYPNRIIFACMIQARLGSLAGDPSQSPEQQLRIQELMRKFVRQSGCGCENAGPFAA